MNVWFTARLFTHDSLNADRMNILLAGKDMMSGNWRLQGWSLPPDNFWGTDIPLVGAVLALTHSTVTAFYWPPALSWTALCLAAWAVAGDGLGATRRLALLAALLVLPPDTANGVTFFQASPTHVLTMIGILVCTTLLVSLREQGVRAYAKLVLLLAVAADAAASDPLFLYLGAPPLIGALVIDWRGRGISGRRAAWLSAALLGACVAGRLALVLNAAHGGLIPAKQYTHFVTIPELPRTIGLTFQAVLDSIGCDPFGLSLSHSVSQLLRLPLLALVAWPAWRLWRVLAGMGRGAMPAPPPDFINCVMALIILGNLALMLVSELMIDVTSIRFILPAWAAGSVLALRTAPPQRWVTLYGAAMALVALGINLPLALHPATPLWPQGVRNSAACLEANHIRQGYAPYWLPHRWM